MSDLDAAYGSGGYYETRCKWCGGSQHARGETCFVLDHEYRTTFSCTCTFEYPQCVCRGSTPSGEVKL